MKTFTSYIAARTYVAIRHEQGLSAVVLPRAANGLYVVQQ